MQEHTKTISLLASELSWDDVDKRAMNIGFKERSRYIQYLIEKDINKTKISFNQILTVILLLILAMLSLVILLVI